MNTLRHPTCPKCGAPLPVDAPKGLCPRCLAAMNLATETVLTEADVLAAQPPLSPAELAPHFPQLEIIECLGRGGMGVVYKARQRSLNRVVALKLLAPERVSDAKFAQRFTHEAQALAALNHPSIVTIYDFGQAGGFYFLLMEFVDGVNLRQAMKAGRFTPDQALAVVPPVCEALQYAHEHGIVHRDIKPENLLLDKDGRVKIADFGIAKILGADGPDVGLAESQPLGTPQYMAPEQKEHRSADHRADIYSLGVVLYEMLTGELPGARLQPPSRKVLIDVRLDEIVLRALEVKPELRYQTAGEMRTQVETIVQTPAGDQGSTALPSWFTWSPWQPPLVREIGAHLTVAEQAEVTRRGLLFGVWNAATFFAPFFCIMFLPRPLGWIFGIAAFAVGLSFYPMWNRIQREFLCSTEWARQQGLKPGQLKRSALARSISLQSPGIRGAWAGLLVCVLIVSGTAIVTSLQPKVYRSTALIMVSSEAPSPMNTLPQLHSRTVLNQVAKELDLARQWAPRYPAEDLTAEGLYRLLKRKLEVRLRTGGTVFEVSYYSENPDEAALFANKIVEVFCAQPFGKGTRLLETAEPGARPIRPNRVLNMLLGLGVGILIGVIVGLLVSLVSAWRANRRHSSQEKEAGARAGFWGTASLLLCAALLLFLMAGLGFAWLKLRGGGPSPTATAQQEPTIARPQELQPQTDVRPQASIPTDIDFQVLRVENPPGTRNILLHFERDTNFGLAIEVSQNVMPSPDRKVPGAGYVDWRRKTWAGLNTSPVLAWTLPAEFSETEARDVAREMQRKWKGSHPLPDGAVPEFANVKHRDGWTYILMARVLREPGSPRPPPPGNAVLLGESVGIVPAGAVVKIEWQRTAKDVSLSPISVPLTFKVADGRPGKLRFRWYTYDSKNPLMAGRWFLDIHDEYTGIIFHRLEDDFGQPVKFVSPIFKLEKVQTFTLGHQAAAVALHKIIHAEPLPPPGQPITKWWDVIMTIVPHPLGKPSPVPEFQLPLAPDSGSTGRYLERETK